MSRGRFGGYFGKALVNYEFSLPFLLIQTFLTACLTHRCHEPFILQLHGLHPNVRNW